MEQPGKLLADGFEQLMEQYGLTRQEVRHRTEDGMWEAGLRPVRENIRKNLANLLDDHTSVSSAQTIEELVLFGLGGTSLNARYLQGLAGHLADPLSVDRRLAQEAITLTISEMVQQGHPLVYVMSRWFDFWAMSAGWGGFFEGGLDRLRRLITLVEFPGRTLPLHAFDFLFDDRIGMSWRLLDLEDLRHYQVHRIRLENLMWTHTPAYRHLPEQLMARLPEEDAADFQQKWEEAHSASMRDLIQYDMSPDDYTLRYTDGSQVLNMLLYNFYLDVTGGSYNVAHFTPKTEADAALLEQIIAPYADADPVYLWEREDLPVIQKPTWP